MNLFKTPLEAFLYWEANTPDNIFFRQPIDGKIHEITYGEAGRQARSVANLLNEIGLQKDDKVAILSKNCAHWLMADLAIMMSGMISVPIYPTLDKESIRIILEHSETKAVFIGKLDDYEQQQHGIPEGVKKISADAYGIVEEYTWSGAVQNQSPEGDIYIQQPDDLITIMYTSGTTGTPKGVMHTAFNFITTVNTAQSLIVLPEHPRFFSYLPLSHIAERIAIEIFGIVKGATFTFPESLDTFAANLEEAKPHLFFAVPRIWSKFQEKILEKMPQKKLNMLLSIPVIKNVIRKKIQEKLGLSEAMYMASGAAPIAASLQQWYQKLGLDVHQDYGMTEDCILSHYNLVGSNRIGSVGRPLPGVETKLTAEGELCIKSAVLMKGYYKEPELTAAMFDEEGYLKTGDVGEYDHDGYLFITGRAKDQFKTDKGKYISPGPIELELLKNNDIDQICIVGMGIPQPIALVILSEGAKTKSKDEVDAGLISSINELNPQLEKHEKIEKVVIMKEDWSVDNGLLTPTLKVKRNQVEKLHMPMYREWFEQEERVIYE